MPAQVYMHDGKRLPSVTTILNRFKDSGGLINWAYKQGCDHGALRALGKPAPQHLYDTVKEAGDIGTQAHAMVEDYTRAAAAGFKPMEAVKDKHKDAHEQAWSAFGAFRTWAEQSKLKVLDCEIKLTSKDHRFGGMIDAIGEIDKRLCLLDWKTSNAVYSDHLLQLAAYGSLWHENNPDQEIVGGYHLCRFAKTEGDFAHHHYPNLEKEERMFMLLREAYDLDRTIRKRAA